MARCLNLHVIGKYVDTENKRGLASGRFWGALFAKLRKKSDHYLRHVFPSAWSNSAAHAGRIFMKFGITGFIEKSVEKIQFSLKSDKNTGCFAWKPVGFMMMSRWILLRIRNISRKKSCKGKKTWILCSILVLLSHSFILVLLSHSFILVLLSHSFIFFRFYFFINVFMVLFPFDNVIYVFLLLWLCILIVCLCMTTLTEGFPCFFSSVVRQMRGYTSQRRGTALTLSNFYVVLCIICVVLCIVCVVLFIICV